MTILRLSIELTAANSILSTSSRGSRTEKCCESVVFGRPTGRLDFSMIFPALRLNFMYYAD